MIARQSAVDRLDGVRARLNAGYGLWQLAFGSKAELTAETYAAARAAMAVLRSDEDRPLGIKADTRVVPSGLEAEARRLILNDTRVVTIGTGATAQHVAASNEWKGSADLMVSSYLG